jgi:uncharacterized protein (UPF0332 family)
MEEVEKGLAKYRLSKAEIEFEISKVLFDKKFYAKSLNSSYYTMFYAVRALLALDKVDSKKHSGVLNHFNNLYIRTGKFPTEYFKYLNSAFTIRLQSDYNDFFVATKKDAELQIENAEKFLTAVKEYLENQKGIR